MSSTFAQVAAAVIISIFLLTKDFTANVVYYPVGTDGYVAAALENFDFCTSFV